MFVTSELPGLTVNAREPDRKFDWHLPLFWERRQIPQIKPNKHARLKPLTLEVGHFNRFQLVTAPLCVLLLPIRGPPGQGSRLDWVAEVNLLDCPVSGGPKGAAAGGIEPVKEVGLCFGGVGTFLSFLWF